MNTGGSTTRNATNHMVYARWSSCSFYPRCKAVYGLSLRNCPIPHLLTSTCGAIWRVYITSKESTYRTSFGVWFKGLWQQDNTCLKFFSIPWILGITGLGYASKLTDSIFSNICKHFAYIKTLLCLINKCIPNIMMLVSLDFLMLLFSLKSSCDHIFKGTFWLNFRSRLRFLYLLNVVKNHSV